MSDAFGSYSTASIEYIFSTRFDWRAHFCAPLFKSYYHCVFAYTVEIRTFSDGKTTFVHFYGCIIF